MSAAVQLAWAAMAALLLLSLVLSGAAPAADEDGFDLRQVTPDQRRRLLRGEMVSYAVAEGSERELTAGLAMYVATTMKGLVDVLAPGEPLAVDPGASTYGAFTDAPGPEAFAAVRFSAADLIEVQALLDAAPGYQANLSAREIDALRSLKTSLGVAATPALLDAVSRHYRRLLWERWRSYHGSGLAGMPPYARRSDLVTDPAAELRAAVVDARRIAVRAPFLPELLLRYPATPPPSPASRFFWLRRTLQGRPAYVLIHQITDVAPDLALLVERHFYVGHSYNVSQTLSGGLPWEGGMLVFTTARVSTDQVAGVGTDLKRALGRRQLRAEVVRRFDRIRAALAKPTRPESP
jgi:hypothetical protein